LEGLGVPFRDFKSSYHLPRTHHVLHDLKNHTHILVRRAWPGRCALVAMYRTMLSTLTLDLDSTLFASGCHDLCQFRHEAGHRGRKHCDHVEVLAA